MGKVIFLGSKNNGGKNDVEVLADAAKKYSTGNHDVQVVYFEDLLVRIAAGEQSIIDTVSDQDIADASLLVAVNWYKNGKLSIYRDIALTIALYLESCAVEFWNKEMLMQRSTSKLSAMMQMALEGVDIPSTSFSLNPQPLLAEVKFPAIVKDVAASRGARNFLVKNQAELDEKLTRTPNRFMIQEYIANDGDYRIVCFDSQPSLIIKRQRTNDNTHLNNTSAGASATIVPLSSIDAAVLEDCRKICAFMGRNAAGIDLLISNVGLSRKVFLEVNPIPQLTSGSFVDDKLKLLTESIDNNLTRKQK